VGERVHELRYLGRDRFGEFFLETLREPCYEIPSGRPLAGRGELPRHSDIRSLIKLIKGY
jgi:hypothetical protein